MRRSVALLASAVAAIGSVPIATVVTSAHAADPAGTLSAIISQGARPGCFTAKYQPTDGYRCPPAAMAVAVLPTGKVLFWDGLEGMNKGQYNVVAEFGDTAQNDQSRVADFTGHNVTFSTPGNQGADGNGTAAEDVDSPLPAGVVDSPGNDYDLFCAPLVQLADGTVLSAGGTKYYLEPGVTDPNGKSYGVSELQGLKATRIFDPKANTWQNLPGTSDMHYGRWYPTLVTLASGQVFVASGVTKLIKPAYTDGRSQFDSGRNVVETETFDPATRTWTVNHSAAAGSDPTLADGSQQSLPLFARLHLLPDGKVYYDAAGQTFNPDGQAYDEANWVHAKVYDPATQTWIDLSADTPTGLPVVDGLPLGFRGSGFDVMLPLVPDAHGNYTKARVFNGGGVVGPTPGSYVGDNSTTINTIDTTGGGDTLTSASGPTLINKRWYGSAVVLPDGQVFVTNGADRDEVDAPGSGSPVLQTELVNRDTSTVTAGPSLPDDHGRTYHNSAVLLPDGRVLIGGHAPIATGYSFQDDTAHQALGFSAAESDSTFQIYSPPYLSDGPRPVITDIDHSATSGGRLEIETPQARRVTKVVLVRNPSMTHLTDGDQRTVEVPITSRDGDELTVHLPNASVLPTGPYMAFIETTSTSGHLVPSVSRQVMVVPDEDKWNVSVVVHSEMSAHPGIPAHPAAPAKPTTAKTATLHAAPTASTSPVSPARREWPILGAAAALLAAVVVRRRLLKP